MIIYYARGTILDYYSFWNTRPSARVIPQHGGKFDVMWDGDKNDMLAQAMYHFDVIFPKFTLSGGEKGRLEIESIEDGYIIKKIEDK